MNVCAYSARYVKERTSVSYCLSVLLMDLVSPLVIL
nr:MAG TPA: hypothetical protein [Caudoviricetes sp.]